MEHGHISDFILLLNFKLGWSYISAYLSQSCVMLITSAKFTHNCVPVWIKNDMVTLQCV